MKHLFLMPAIVAMTAGVFAAEWKTDYSAALAQAKEEGKAVLANFTGSDWCSFCISLKAEVLESPAFSAWSQKHFVHLEVDMPENPNFDAELRRQNQALCKKYGVDAYPTVLVLDAAGRPLGGLLGYEGDEKAVRELLQAALDVHRHLQDAASCSGEKKLQALLEAWRLIPEELKPLNAEIKAELMAIDTQDISGLRAEADAEQRLKACELAAKAAPTDAAALEIVDAALFEAVPFNKRQLLEMKYRLLILLAETHEDVWAAADVAYAALDADLRLTEEVKINRKKQLQGVFANPQTTLNRSRMIKRHRPKR